MVPIPVRADGIESRLLPYVVLALLLAFPLPSVSAALYGPRLL